MINPPIHTQWHAVCQVTISPEPSPPPLPFLPFPCIAVPAIRVKLLADACSSSSVSSGLFNESQDGRVLETEELAGMLFVT